MSDEKLLTLKDLFEHKVKDLYSSQEQLETAYQKMAQHVSHDALKSQLKKYQQETKENRKNIESIGQDLGFNPKGVKCTGTEGIVKEGKELMEAKADADVVDAGLLSNAQVIAHYEIANYGAAYHYAKRLGYDQAAEIFGNVIEKQKDADAKLAALAKDSINADAAQ
ncbi:MAG: DUF892 family protein [Tunicatimonas sp.]